jgi:hypothetical protein
MLNALLVTLGIAVVLFSLFYKFLLMLYQSGQRSQQRREEDTDTET